MRRGLFSRCEAFEFLRSKELLQRMQAVVCFIQPSLFSAWFRVCFRSSLAWFVAFYVAVVSVPLAPWPPAPGLRASMPG